MELKRVAALAVGRDGYKFSEILHVTFSAPSRSFINTWRLFLYSKIILFFCQVLEVRYLAVPGRLVVFFWVCIEFLFFDLCNEKIAKKQSDCVAGNGEGEGIAEKVYAQKRKNFVQRLEFEFSISDCAELTQL